MSHPRLVLLTVAVQVLVMPPVAILMARLFQLPSGVAMGLLFVAALPGGSYSNLLTHLGKGNGALSITATAVATLACPLTAVLVRESCCPSLWLGLPAAARSNQGRHDLNVRL